jgi:hypothetical protein
LFAASVPEDAGDGEGMGETVQPVRLADVRQVSFYTRILIHLVPGKNQRYVLLQANPVSPACWRHDRANTPCRMDTGG